MSSGLRVPTAGDTDHQPGRVGEHVWVGRFGRTERFAHWWTVLMVVVALVSGLSLGDESSGGPMLWLHVGSVVLIGVGLIVAAGFGDHRALIRAAGQLFRFDARDHAWLNTRLRHPLSRHPDPRRGLFNTGQKLLAWALTVSVVAVVVTGVQSWRAGGEGSLHGSAVVVTMVLLSAHVFMAVANPATRPALAGMVFGRVRRSWAAAHHPGWLDDVDRADGNS